MKENYTQVAERGVPRRGICIRGLQGYARGSPYIEPYHDFLSCFRGEVVYILLGRLSFCPFLTTALSVYRIEPSCPPDHLQVLVASVSVDGN